MPPALHHPDVAMPPTGWTYSRVGSQIRLSPPGSLDGTAGATIIVSPLVARHKGLPSIDRLIAAAIEVEEKQRLHIVERSGPTPMKTTTGLAGCYCEVRGHLRQSDADLETVMERRVYIMYADALCYYGIHYVASEPVYEKYLKLFLDAARSVKPFQGRVMAQPAAASSAEERALHGSYRD